MIEKIILDYLKGVLSVPVYCERPKEKPDEYVIVEKTNMTKTNLLYDSHIVIQSNAETLYKAMLLDSQVRDAMESDDIPVNVDLESSYNLTDTATKTYRYQSAYNIYHY